MGIRVGKTNPKPFTADASMNLGRNALKQTYTDEERKALVASLMRLPKDKVLPALRSAGLDKEADELEQKLAQEHLGEMRKEKLAGIMALPEEERLTALLDNGFNEEAAAESKRQAESKLWSAVITLLNKYNVIDINDDATHALLEAASNPELNTAERVLFCNDNGLVALGEAYTSVLDGVSLEELEEKLAADSKVDEGAGEGTGDSAETPENGNGETPAENEASAAPANAETPAEAPADGEGEKKKVGRPKKNAE
ncbi:MAG: hypothetical protein IJ647_01900 [Prevotella sp.]|nr:hypothetical protein [Prevotella sp.]